MWNAHSAGWLLGGLSHALRRAVRRRRLSTAGHAGCGRALTQTAVPLFLSASTLAWCLLLGAPVLPYLGQGCAGGWLFPQACPHLERERSFIEGLVPSAAWALCHLQYVNYLVPGKAL